MSNLIFVDEMDEEAARTSRKREIESMLFAKLLGEQESIVSPERDDSSSILSDSTTRRRRAPSRALSTSSVHLDAARRELEADRELLRRPQRVSSAEEEVFHASSSTTTSRATKKRVAVLLGSRRTGKTLIAERLMALTRVVPKPTVGVERHEATVDGENLTLWDTSGDQRFDEAAANLARRSSAVVVVFKAGDQESFSSAAEKLLRAKCDAPTSAKFALVSTKLGGAEEEDLEVVNRADRLAKSTGAFYRVIDPTDRDMCLQIFRELLATTTNASTTSSSKRKNAFSSLSPVDPEDLARLTTEVFRYSLAFAFTLLLALALPSLPPFEESSSKY